MSLIDNDNAKAALITRRSRNKYVRHLLRLLTWSEIRHGYRVTAYYVNTKHNILNDTISRVFDPRSATNITDTQRVVDGLYPGLTYEPLDTLFDYLTDATNILSSHLLPEDVAERRSPTAILDASYSGTTTNETCYNRVLPQDTEAPAIDGVGFEHCGGILQLARAFEAHGARPTYTVRSFVW